MAEPILILPVVTEALAEAAETPVLEDHPVFPATREPVAPALSAVLAAMGVPMAAVVVVDGLAGPEIPV